MQCREPNRRLRKLFQHHSYSVSSKEDPRSYGKEMEPVAIRCYIETRSHYNAGIPVEFPGLHVNDKYASLAASHDEEPLEVKRSSTQNEKTPEVPRTDGKFCCELAGNDVTLKKSHP